jgi:hypothetical protein
MPEQTIYFLPLVVDFLADDFLAAGFFAAAFLVAMALVPPFFCQQSTEREISSQRFFSTAISFFTIAHHETVFITDAQRVRRRNRKVKSRRGDAGKFAWRESEVVFADRSASHVAPRKKNLVNSLCTVCHSAVNLHHTRRKIRA